MRTSLHSLRLPLVASTALGTLRSCWIAAPLTSHPGSAFVIGTETDKLARVCWSCVAAYFEKPPADALGLYTALRAGALPTIC